LLPLLRGRLVADRVILEGADVRLVRRADGTANWDGIGSQDATAEKPAADEPMELRIDGIVISDSRVSFVDEGVPRRVEVTALNLSTDGIAPGQPFTDTEISGVLHMDGFVAQGLPFELKVPRAVASVDGGALEVAQFSLAFGVFEAAGNVKGTVSEPIRLAGAIESNTFDARALLLSVGVAAPKTTDPDALRKLQLAATWSVDAGAISIQPFTLTLDDTHFSGHFTRGAGEAPLGEFALRGDSLALARYIPPADPDSEPFVMPTAALKALKFSGVVELEQATLDDIEMKGVTLRLLLDEQGLRQVAPAAAGQKP
jgi:uncharacterized protein involved in outer membrane biogenesis